MQEKVNSIFTFPSGSAVISYIKLYMHVKCGRLLSIFTQVNLYFPAVHMPTGNTYLPLLMLAFITKFFLQNYFDTVGLVIWPVKIVPEMTYNVSSGTLSLYTTTTYRIKLLLLWESSENIRYKSVMYLLTYLFTLTTKHLPTHCPTAYYGRKLQYGWWTCVKANR